jgi:membrane protease YdiL (CAAX protease family)
MLDNPSLALQIADDALFVASLGVWALVFWRWRSGRTIVPYEPRRPVPWLGVDLALIILAFLIVGALIGHFAPKPHEATSSGPAADSSAVVKSADASKGKSERRDSDSKTSTASELAVNMVAELAMAGVAVGWVVFRVRATPRDLGFSFSRIGSDVVLGWGAFLAAFVPVMELQVFLAKLTPYEHPLIRSLKHQPDALMMSIVAVSAVVVAPLAEELFFRVLIQGCFEAVEVKRRWLLTVRRLPDPSSMPPSDANSAAAVRPVATEEELTALGGPAAWPIVASSFLFALMHSGQGAAPIPLFIFSLFLGYVYQRTHRIWPSLVTHLLLNAMTMTTLWIDVMNHPK